MHEYVYMQQFMHLCIYVSSYMCIPKFRKDACTRMQIWNKPHAHHHVHARRSLCRCLQEQTTSMCMQRLDTSMLVDSYIPFWHTQRHVHNSCVCTQDMVMLLKRYSLFWVGKIPQLRAGGALQWKSSWASVSGWCDSDMHAGVAKSVRFFLQIHALLSPGAMHRIDDRKQFTGADDWTCCCLNSSSATH